MKEKTMRRSAEIKQKPVLYEQELDPQEILAYIPAGLKKKLSGRDREGIKKAFYLTVMEYKKRYEEKYLDRMLI